MSNYVYVRSEPGLWTVGFYAPDGRWNSEADFGDPEKAAERVAWLNGSGPHIHAHDKLVEALEAVKRHGLIEQDGYETVVNLVGEALKLAKP